MKNAKVGKFIKKLGRGVRLIVIGPLDNKPNSKVKYPFRIGFLHK